MASQPNNDPTNGCDQHHPTQFDQALLALNDLDFRIQILQNSTAEANAIATQLRQLLQSPSEQDNRPVCIIDMEPIDPEEAEALPCGHVFHSDCIPLWLAHSNTCPVDRLPVHQMQTEPAELDGDGSSVHEAQNQTSDGLNSSRTTTENESDRSAGSASISTTTSRTSSSTINQSQIEQLAFHHRLIRELELLQIQGGERAAEGAETQLNLRWAAFLRTSIDGLRVKIEGLEDEILGPEAEEERT